MWMKIKIVSRAVSNLLLKTTLLCLLLTAKLYFAKELSIHALGKKEKKTKLDVPFEKYVIDY